VSAGLEQLKGGKYRANGKNNWSTGVQSMDFEEIQSQFEAGSKHMKLLWLARSPQKNRPLFGVPCRRHFRTGAALPTRAARSAMA
jgi:hypothetical protein